MASEENEHTAGQESFKPGSVSVNSWETRETASPDIGFHPRGGCFRIEWRACRNSKVAAVRASSRAAQSGRNLYTTERKRGTRQPVIFLFIPGRFVPFSASVSLFFFFFFFFCCCCLFFCFSSVRVAKEQASRSFSFVATSDKSRERERGSNKPRVRYGYTCYIIFSTCYSHRVDVQFANLGCVFILPLFRFLPPTRSRLIGNFIARLAIIVPFVSVPGNNCSVRYPFRLRQVKYGISRRRYINPGRIVAHEPNAGLAARLMSHEFVNLPRILSTAD